MLRDSAFGSWCWVIAFVTANEPTWFSKSTIYTMGSTICRVRRRLGERATEPASKEPVDQPIAPIASVGALSQHA